MLWYKAMLPSPSSLFRATTRAQKMTARRKSRKNDTEGLSGKVMDGGSHWQSNFKT